MCETKTKVARCKVCGCTDDHACVVREVPCCWIERDLCSACAPIATLVATAEGREWVRYLVDVTEATIAFHAPSPILTNALIASRKRFSPPS